MITQTHDFVCVDTGTASYMASTLRDVGVTAAVDSTAPTCVLVRAYPSRMWEIAEQAVEKGFITADERARLPYLPDIPEHMGKTHRLPVSNGFEAIAIPDQPTVYMVRCGRCAAEFRPDRDWLLRYGAHCRNHYRRSHERGYYDAEEYQARIAALEQTEAKIGAWLDTPRTTP